MHFTKQNSPWTEHSKFSTLPFLSHPHRTCCWCLCRLESTSNGSCTASSPCAPLRKLLCNLTLTEIWLPWVPGGPSVTLPGRDAMAPFKKQKKKTKQLSNADRKSLNERQSERPLVTLPPADVVQPVLPLELQQTILNVFANALQLAEGVDLSSTVQIVKGHLFRRDFLGAFGNPDNLSAYALRWSAGRALAYAQLLASPDLEHCWVPQQYRVPPQNLNPEPQFRRVVCIGGGAGAELVALAALIRKLSVPHPRLYVHAVDIADWWAPVLHKLQIAIEEPPPLPPYANEAAEVANIPLVEANRLDVHFDKQDVLEYSADQLRSTLTGNNVTLVTIMFTLNELFTSSIAKTTALLLGLTDAMEQGSWLLVVDSPGSYSEVALGQGAPKKYPMQWLLDHTLLQVAGNITDGTSKWRKCLTDESRWFRIDSTLEYPVELEDMRYQIHLFQREDHRGHVEGA